MKRTWIIDAGHGGSRADGTYVTSPSKMYKHSPGVVFYEGVWTRQVKNLVVDDGWAEGMDVIDLVGSDLDIPLKARSGMVNALCEVYPNAFLISLHSNASPKHNADGTEVFAHPNSKTSQKYGNWFGEQWMKDFRNLRFRKGNGQLCKTANFHMLRETNCPAILPECLFYDYYLNFKILENLDFQTNYAKSIIRFMRRVDNE